MKKLWDKVWIILPYVWAILMVLLITAIATLLGSMFIYIIVDIWRAIL